LADLDFGRRPDPGETRAGLLASLAAAAKGLGPGDALVALAHLGHRSGPEGRPTGPELASVPGLAAVIDGHGHVAIDPCRPAPGGAVYLNCGRGLEAAATISFDRGSEPEARLWRYETLRLEEPDPVLAALVEGLGERLSLSKTVARLPRPFARRREGPGGLPPVGLLICRALMRRAGADFAMLNQGSVRAGLSGEAKRGDVFECLPFADRLFRRAMSGAEVLDLARRLVQGSPEGLPYLSGLRVAASRAPGREAAVERAALESGETVGAGGRYRLAAGAQALRRAGLPPGPEDEDLGDLAEMAMEGLAAMSPDDLAEAAAAPEGIEII
jgi:2',3'-cyclic-nucleotide 2'-phosphodiesterase (5'-nucleotidase family)